MLMVVGVGCESPPTSESSTVREPLQSVQDDKNRFLGIAITPSSQDYTVALEDAIGAGMEVFEVPQPWKAVDNRDNVSLLKLFNNYFSDRGIRVVLSLNPLDTLENQIPRDLQDTAFNNTQFIERYISFADTTLDRISKVELVSIAVGNEVDILLGDDAKQWQQYTDFFVQAKRHLNQAYPDIKVGVKVTFKAFQNQRERVDRIVAASDLVMITYYPLTDGLVRDVDTVRSDIAAIAAAYPDKPIQLNEVGYPTSPELQSSPEKQADFVSSVFEAWDATPQVELVTFVWLNDMTPNAVRKLERAYGSNPIFVESLATLGIRSHDGTPKPAFERLRQETKRRGFGITNR